MDSNSPVTLKNLAQELGVNISTVSRVLNDPLGAASKWASPQTTERIMTMARERGYRKNPHAASLRTARSNMVGVIVPRLQDYVLATIYEGIDQAATERGLFTVVANSLDSSETQEAKAELLLDRRADGLIFGDAHIEDPYLDALARRGVPLALVSRSCPGHVSVTCDDYAGGALIAQHFITAGYTSFALIAGRTGTSTSSNRSQGFLDTLHGAGFDVPENRILHGGFDVPAGQEAAGRLLAEGPLPQAVFAVNDFAAIGALGVFHAAGLRTPDDLALAGYNDTPLAAGVGLTSVRSPMYDMGRLGLEKLLALVDGQACESATLAPDLVVRVST